MRVFEGRERAAKPGSLSRSVDRRSNRALRRIEEMREVVEGQGFLRGERIFVVSAVRNGRNKSRGFGSAPS
jgi:hypothetical protein